MQLLVHRCDKCGFMQPEPMKAVRFYTDGLQTEMDMELCHNCFRDKIESDKQFLGGSL